jgi:hypothetical protein
MKYLVEVTFFHICTPIFYCIIIITIIIITGKYIITTDDLLVQYISTCHVRTINNQNLITLYNNMQMNYTEGTCCTKK